MVGNSRSVAGHAGGAGLRILEPTPENVRLAAEALRKGMLVGMPTETVYGIAADAGSVIAVRAIFEAKGRPADNPLIVHVAHVAQAEALVTEFPEEARLLAEAFWPGPLTMVLPKRASVSEIVTGGLDTGAIRVPDHPVALRLIDESGLSLAAPSANMFMRLSPTNAQDLDPELGVRMEMILDGGPCTVGLESTVVDLTGPGFHVLRPGAITEQTIAGVLGVEPRSPEGFSRRSPGQYPRHYAPKTRLSVVTALRPMDAGLTFETGSGPRQIQMPHDPRAYAVSLYAALHRLDAEGHEILFVEAPPRTPEWVAVWDRLSKASSDREI